MYPQTAHSGAPKRPALPHLELGQELFAILTDGAPPSGYHIARGCSVRDAATKKPQLSSYSTEWRAAKEKHPDDTLTDRRFNPYVLAQHIAGKYDVAWQFPSWTSLVVFDIDRPNVADIAGEDQEQRFMREISADASRDRVLAALWRAFDYGAERQPVVLSTPGAGYHVYMPVSRGNGQKERTWPAAVLRNHLEAKIASSGLKLRPGTLELFPAGTRLRAPCGNQMALLSPTRPDDPDDLGLVLVHAKRAARRRSSSIERVVVRSVSQMTRNFIERIEASRLPLGQWLGDESLKWDCETGPFSGRFRKTRASNQRRKTDATQHNVDVLGEPCGCLLYGEAFLGRIRDLVSSGLDQIGLRHDGALKLCWYWGVCLGLSWNEISLRFRRWLGDFSHASGTRSRSPNKFVKETLREAAHYFRRHVEPLQRGGTSGRTDLAPLPLPQEDKDAVLVRVDPKCRDEAETILRLLYSQSDPNGRVRGSVTLSSGILSRLAGERRVRERDAQGRLSRRRATTMATEELLRLGILTLQTNYSTGRHGRIYNCWYGFGSARLPNEISNRASNVEHKALEEGRPDRAQRDGGPDLLEKAVRAAKGSAKSRYPSLRRLFSRKRGPP